MVEATVEVIGLELGQQPLRASVALKDLYNVLYSLCTTHYTCSS